MPTSVLETQLQEFGRVPRQLFTEPHPPRLKIPRWEPGRLREDERRAAALDAGGELRLWDLRQRCESVRLKIATQAGGGLSEASCFLTDFAGWAILGGTSSAHN